MVSFNFSQIETELKAITSSQEQTVNWDDVIPTDPEEFYRDFGYISHAGTMLPVEHLADFQIRTWKRFMEYKRILEIKSNKIGETTKWLIVDFQLAMLPSTHPLSCRGYDQLVIGQTKDMAKQHLRDLRRMIIDSKKYNKYLIDRPTEIYEDGQLIDVRRVMRDEQTKTSVIYLFNPDKPTRPSRLIALGCENPGSILSWKAVKNIHFSDPTATQGDYTASINSAITRLSNTDGSMIIETVPGLPHGKVFEMWTEARTRTWQKGDFWLEIVTSDEAVKAGVISTEFLEAARRQLGAKFDQYYNAKFGAITGGVFLPEQVDACKADYEYAPTTILTKYPRSLGIDMGFGSSRSAFVASVLLQGKVHIVHAQDFERPDFNDMLKHAISLIMEYSMDKIFVDGANPEFIRALKKMLGERVDYDRVMEEQKDMDYERVMKVVPVYFNQDNLKMLTHAQQIVSEGQLAIHKDFDKLMVQMRAAATNDNGTLDKKVQSLDLVDALFLNLRRFHY